jgi:hypothetical protein
VRIVSEPVGEPSVVEGDVNMRGRGRPPKAEGDRLTAADRARRYRDKVRARKAAGVIDTAERMGQRQVAGGVDDTAATANDAELAAIKTKLTIEEDAVFKLRLMVENFNAAHKQGRRLEKDLHRIYGRQLLEIDLVSESAAEAITPWTDGRYFREKADGGK